MAEDENSVPRQSTAKALLPGGSRLRCAPRPHHRRSFVIQHQNPSKQDMRLRYLSQLAKSYPSQQAAAARIVALKT